jgi:hypothetical protein
MGSWAATPAAGFANPPARATGPLALQVRLAVLTVALLPLNWVMGTTLLWVYLVTAVALLAPERPSGLELALGALAGALVLGLMVAILTASPGDRVIASLYNLTIIAVMAGCLNLGRKLQARSAQGLERLYRTAHAIFLVQIAMVALVTVAVSGSSEPEVAFRTLVLGLLGELPGVLAQYSKFRVAETDWTSDGPEPRIVGFGVYATEGAILLLLTGLLAVAHAARRGRRGRVLVYEGLIVVALIAMASRTTLLAYVASLALLPALLGRRVGIAALALAPLGIVGAGLAVAHGTDLAAAAFGSLNESRPGSSGTRFLSYATAIRMVLDANILTGLGIKPVDETLMLIPIGSHSTLVSMFTKGGLVALAALLCLYATLLAGVARSQIALLGGAFAREPARRLELVCLARGTLALMMWWLTEDFDAPAHQAAIGGLFLGLFWGCLRAATAPRRRALWPGPA